MRIPITKGDWPSSFNSTSKYIGRHWPSGKLKLSEAREKTAHLMGYHSIHDVQQELLNAIPSKFYSTKAMASSMAVKAVLMYKLDPVESYRYFSSIPWSNLDVWKSTNEYWQQQMEAKGTRFMLDEFHTAMNYSTPALIAGAYTKGLIPSYEFTISENGDMFHRGTFESLLELMVPEEQDIKECGSSLSVEEYFYKYILPLSHCSVEEMITRLNPEKPLLWLTPTDVHIQEVNNGSYVLLNKSLNAFYPGSYDSVQLRETIKKLFILEAIPDVVTHCNVPKDIYGISMDEIEHYGSHGAFVFHEQVYYRREKLNNYSEVIDNPFLTYLLQNMKPTKGFAIPESIISEPQLDVINKAMTIDTMIMKSNPDGVIALIDLGISNVLSSLYGETYYGDETLLKDDSFDLSERHFEDEDEQLEAEKEVREYTVFCDSLGRDVLWCMPELKEYYSERVIGHYFHERYRVENDFDDWRAEEVEELNTEAERHLEFFVLLLNDHLCIEFNEYARGVAYKGVSWLLKAVNSKRINMDEFKGGFIALMSVYRMLNKDKRVFSEMDKYCTHSQIELDGEYINHGAACKPIFKKDVDKNNEYIMNQLRLGRKISSKPITASQNVSDY